MGLDQHVGDGNLVGEIRPPAAPGPGVLMVADAIPGPAVKRPLLDAGDIVGWKIIAQQVALVGGAVDDTCARLHCQPRAVADPRGKDFFVFPIGSIG